MSVNGFGAVHKVCHALGGGVCKRVTVCDKGGRGGLKICDVTLFWQNENNYCVKLFLVDKLSCHIRFHHLKDAETGYYLYGRRNPRYQKVIDVAIHHFAQHSLDGLFIAINAPGHSAFNRVERLMALLISRKLFGCVLPHEHFGSHIDSQGRTVDDTLLKSKFKFAGKIWSDVMIDKFPVIAEYIRLYLPRKQ